MPNNVATTKEAVINTLYRVFIWTGAWTFTFRDILRLPVLVVTVWALSQLLLPNVAIKISNTVVIGGVVEISQDLVKLGAFATLMVLFIKISILIKNDVQTLWNIWTPRYKEYGKPPTEKSYNDQSIFTEGYLLESRVSAKELRFMDRQSKKFFISSAITYVIIQLTLWSVGETTVVSPLEAFLSESTSSQLLFAIIGLPILFANITNNLTFSLYPTAETALFFIEIGVPSILFIFGLQNRISYYKYIRMNRALDEEESIFLYDLLDVSDLAFNLVIGGVVFGATIFVVGRFLDGFVSVFVMTLTCAVVYILFLLTKDKVVEVIASVVNFNGRTNFLVPGETDALALSPDVTGFREVNRDLERQYEMIRQLQRDIVTVQLLLRRHVEITPAETVALEEAIDNVWGDIVDNETGGELIYGKQPLGHVTADYHYLSCLLRDVLENAVERGGADVTVRVKRIQDGFAIADDGPKMPAPVQEQVFEEWYSLADDGLGLRIVKWIVEAHKWQMDLADSETGGTRIEFTNVEFHSADR